MRKLLLSLFTLCILSVSNLFAECDIPEQFSGNTGSNMTVMLTETFLNSLGVVNEGAYIVAYNADDLIVGSANVYGVTQNTIALWADDATTGEVVDGAVGGETIMFQLVDGTNLYDINDGSILMSVTYVVNGFTSQAIAVSTSLVCSQEAILGCTDETATNYNADATEDDGSCEYTPSTCVLPANTVTNTGSSMTVFLSSNFINSLPITNTNAYVVALSSSIGVVGVAEVYDLSSGQTSIAVWADDATTPEVDGAIAGETITYQFVNGAELYDIEESGVALSDLYVVNGIVGQGTSVSPVFNCEGSIAAVSGCIDGTACNYNELATEDDGSCTYAETNYNCDGICLNDADSDGVCDEDEVLGCMDPTATNYNELATDDDGSCDYPPVVEGCTDIEANNYNPSANTDDGSCLYGVGGCTYEEATNYDSEATYDDASCTFDEAFIYVTNPIDGGIYTTASIVAMYEVVNIDIGTPVDFPEGGHVRYSIDGGAFAPIFTQSGEIALEFENGDHTIEFVVYDNVSGNLQPWSPAIETIVNFSVGVEGCTNPLAGNYNPDAVIEDDSCIANADLDFSNVNTGNNHTLLVLAEEIAVSGMIAQPGDLLGVFYLNNGSYSGGGYGSFTGGTMQFSAWGDDATTTGLQDGFLNGQEFVWAIQFQETGNSIFLQANYIAPGMDVFTTNAISTIVSFEEMELLNVPGCTDSTYVEYNPFATVDNGSCLTLKTYGCTDASYLEYWDYDSINHTVSEIAVAVNTEDGSCETLIIEGCTSDLYLDYCDVCNVMNMVECVELIVEGCMDPLALNYDSLANVDNALCEYDICVQLNIENFSIDYLAATGATVLAFDLHNISDKVIINPVVEVVLDTNPDIQLSDSSMHSTADINPTNLLGVNTEIISDLELIQDFVLLSGQVNITGLSQGGDSIDCWFDFTEVYIVALHIGCTDANAYNYDSNATIDDGSCVDNLSASIVVSDPLCTDSYGAATIYVTGGFTPYSSPTAYVSYMDNGEPVNSTISFTVSGVAYLTGLEVGEYVIEIHDNSEIVSFYDFIVEEAEEIAVEANILSSGLLSSTVTIGEEVMYQWLLNGSSIEGANSSTHYADTIGYYQVYVENELGCGDYSEEVYLDFVAVDELNEASFSMYPNPANSNITVNLNRLTQKANLFIADILGQKVYEQEIDSRNESQLQTIEVSDLANGVYFISVETESRRIIKRFVKN